MTLQDELQAQAHTCHKQGCAGRRFDDHPARVAQRGVDRIPDWGKTGLGRRLSEGSRAGFLERPRGRDADPSEAGVIPLAPAS